MEFKILRNIETGFKQIRMYAIIFASLCLVITLFSIGYAYYFAEQQREKIYVLDNGKSLILALSQDAEQNRPVEAREHIRRFHEFFFNIAPDKAAIESNMKRAFFLADKTAFNYYNDLAEKGYYNRIISGNIRQRIQVDSIVCDFNTYPYQVQTYAKQYITRSSNRTERQLVTACQLVNSVRSDNNPQGFIIEQFRVIQNEDIQTVER
ncbi:conjugative transposon protein TraK [Riemerella anatipestifer]|uniref:Conjugative transposon protein TraK n=1 Tax=Riemerella anatipestifer TaxID=34085 RepID=A0AAP3AR64_RIEAN|nr:conjugative transposon protein TraK [Riemerella anatipestifer]AZZ58480.1 conjugative transposon protein TraK [Riemerella anatipestifer]MBT0573078.1 conjugative transposon protein TraK [Riemerella anatipestifer]MCO7318930.1 conjugative transposon protein TraK [Riemerella anatipestifer]MCQ4155215.1 conjugative transposon protein TraK [Riemerella anatipestifer]MCQ4181176.1 conjugative transposon protein TraK [Riemerella anatipestifer]